MKKNLFQGLVFLFGMCVSFTAFWSDFGYPLDQIAKPSCRKEAWSTLDDTCKMTLPRIANADYEKFKNDSQYRRIYTVLWGATYDYGWDVGLGSHLWVDIATSVGTPVLAFAAGEVIKSDFSSGWGNSITIKHTLADKTNIYSNYAHLSKRNVNKWDIVKLGQNIGEVGNTGNSYGNHLHFQVDITDQFHPYYYVTCAKGKNLISLVNQGDCRSYLMSNTIDPIAFIETGTMGVVPPTAHVIETIKNKPSVVIQKQTIKSREEILNEESEEFLKSYRIVPIFPSHGTVVPIGSSYQFNVEVRDFNKKFSKKNIPWAGVRVTVDEKKATAFPANFTQLYGGIRWISITPKTTGPIEIIFSIWKKEIARKKIYGIVKGSTIVTNDTETLTIKKWFIGQEYDMYVSPLVDSTYYVGKSTWTGKYRLEIVKGKAKFCLKVPPKWASCPSDKVVETLEFSKKDTPNGFFTTRILPLSIWRIEIRIIQVGKPSGHSTKITGEIPTGLDRKNVYYDTIIAGLSKNWRKTRGGYVWQNEEMNTEMIREFLLRVLDYQILKAGTNKVKRQLALNNRELFLRSSKSLESKKWSRGAFAELFLKSLRIPTETGNPRWMDAKGTFQDTLTVLDSKYRFQWQDQFGEKYFQPDKIITLTEAMYLVGEVAP